MGEFWFLIDWDKTYRENHNPSKVGPHVLLHILSFHFQVDCPTKCIYGVREMEALNSLRELLAYAVVFVSVCRGIMIG
jgi:hypothetical protein